MVIDGLLAVSDADSGDNLASATVRSAAGFIGGDTLNFTKQNGISGSYNSATGVLTLTGTASTANYQTALEVDHLQLHGEWRSDWRRHAHDAHHQLGGPTTGRRNFTARPAP